MAERLTNIAINGQVVEAQTKRERFDGATDALEEDQAQNESLCGKQEDSGRCNQVDRVRAT